MVSCFRKRNEGIREFSSIETKSCHTTTRVVYVIGYTKVYPNLEDNTVLWGTEYPNWLAILIELSEVCDKIFGKPILLTN